MPVIDNSSGTRTDCYRIMSLNQYEESNKEKYVCEKVSRILPAIALFPLYGCMVPDRLVQNFVP